MNLPLKPQHRLLFQYMKKTRRKSTQCHEVVHIFMEKTLKNSRFEIYNFSLLTRAEIPQSG